MDGDKRENKDTQDDVSENTESETSVQTENTKPRAFKKKAKKPKPKKRLVVKLPFGKKKKSAEIRVDVTEHSSSSTEETEETNTDPLDTSMIVVEEQILSDLPPNTITLDKGDLPITKLRASSPQLPGSSNDDMVQKDQPEQSKATAPIQTDTNNPSSEQDKNDNDSALQKTPSASNTRAFKKSTGKNDNLKPTFTSKKSKGKFQNLKERIAGISTSYKPQDQPTPSQDPAETSGNSKKTDIFRSMRKPKGPKANPTVADKDVVVTKTPTKRISENTNQTTPAKILRTDLGIDKDTNTGAGQSTSRQATLPEESGSSHDKGPQHQPTPSQDPAPTSGNSRKSDFLRSLRKKKGQKKANPTVADTTTQETEKTADSVTQTPRKRKNTDTETEIYSSPKRTPIKYTPPGNGKDTNKSGGKRNLNDVPLDEEFEEETFSKMKEIYSLLGAKETAHTPLQFDPSINFPMKFAIEEQEEMMRTQPKGSLTFNDKLIGNKEWLPMLKDDEVKQYNEHSEMLQNYDSIKQLYSQASLLEQILPENFNKMSPVEKFKCKAAFIQEKTSKCTEQRKKKEQFEENELRLITQRVDSLNTTLSSRLDSWVRTPLNAQEANTAR